MKYREKATVLSCEEIGTGIFSLRLGAEQIASSASPGQFVSVYSRDSARLLPRPISVCEADAEHGILRLVFRIAGKGTREFSRCREGDQLDLAGPLGNGFDLSVAQGKRVFVIGGGIGIPPMLGTAKCLAARGQNVTAVLGYRDERFLADEFPCRTVIATEDGSCGTRGNVLDAIREAQLDADVIFACGPTPMLRAIRQYSMDRRILCWLSMEEKMACGIGACLSCVCRSTDIDAHSQVRNKRVCTEGPVFLATEIEL
jgi:dihydroorotate dehydrogenase electron transfer subunit